jgi:hypothetical protein
VAGIVKPVVALTSAGTKDLGHGGGHVDEQMTGGDLAFAQDPPVEVETAPSHNITMCDVSSVPRRTRAIDRDAVCGLFIECLQDVSFVALALRLLVIYCLVSYFRLFFAIGC